MRRPTVEDLLGRSGSDVDPPGTPKVIPIAGSSGAALVPSFLPGCDRCVLEIEDPGGPKMTGTGVATGGGGGGSAAGGGARVITGGSGSSVAARSGEEGSMKAGSIHGKIGG